MYLALVNLALSTQILDIVGSSQFSVKYYKILDMLSLHILHIKNQWNILVRTGFNMYAEYSQLQLTFLAL